VLAINFKIVEAIISMTVVLIGMFTILVVTDHCQWSRSVPDVVVVE
jgi:hypothetical protein